ncbi:MAG: oxidoreductase [Acidimicrobiales bacterium]|nr:oxidoreductase [Acidimicrobiales bacterium]MYG88863.1 oxidoreductase [Acidimicrobiales bacterium]MYI28218.1 oxidoreductase [Acidimicrobiales bacterium]
MSNSPKRIVIVGASLAGARAAHSVRAAGHDGPLTLIGAEPHLPYDRPPLSKEFLTGDQDPGTLALDPDGAYDDLDVEVMLSTHAVGLDTDARVVMVAPAAGGNAETVPFDGLVIATGAAARPLPGVGNMAGVHTLRTLDDSMAIREGLIAGARVSVVGGGFIGSEVAASAAARGCEVTVIEAAPAPLVRGLGAEMGTRVGALHGHNGVELRLGVGVDGVLGTDQVEAVAMADGSRIPADLVVVGIGVVPNTAWLEGSGLQVDNGVVCDATLCCGPPGVYAVGDVARAPNGWLSPWHGDRPIRVEHWTAAVEHGMAVGRNLVAPAEAQPYSSVPFVWSDQYDARIQIAGHPDADDDVEVLVGSAADDPDTGSPDSGRSFLAGYRRNGRLSGVMALDAIRPFVRFRRLLAAHPSWDDALELAATLN